MEVLFSGSVRILTALQTSDTVVKKSFFAEPQTNQFPALASLAKSHPAKFTRITFVVLCICLLYWLLNPLYFIMIIIIIILIINISIIILKKQQFAFLCPMIIGSSFEVNSRDPVRHNRKCEQSVSIEHFPLYQHV